MNPYERALKEAIDMAFSESARECLAGADEIVGRA
jgi:hypothetical protein